MIADDKHDMISSEEDLKEICLLYTSPVVKLNPEVKDFYQFTTDDLIVENYETWPQIKNIPVAI